MVSVEIRRKKDKSVLCRFEVWELPERRLERMALLASRVDKVPELGVALAEIRKLGYELYEWKVEPAKVGWKRIPGRNQKGENNANYGNRWGSLTRKRAKRSHRASAHRIRGKRNPAKRQSSRRKISLALSGEGNPNSKVWEVRFPDGREVVFKGGIHRFLESVGLTYYQVQPVIEGRAEDFQGWCVKRRLVVEDGNMSSCDISGFSGHLQTGPDVIK